MSFQDNMDIGKEGYCLAPGHPVKHVLTVRCWPHLRNLLLVQPNTTYEQYVEMCKNKKR